MGRINSKLNLLTEPEMKLIYEVSLKILEAMGMKIDDERFLQALESKGATVNYASRIVKFPKKLLRDATKKITEESLVSSSVCQGAPSINESKYKEVRYRWGGGPALHYLDYEKNELRKGTEKDALKIIKLADVLPEISHISSTMLVYSVDLDNRPFDPRLYTLRSVGLTAKNTSKISYAENIYSVKELEYLIKIGCVIRGDIERLKENPTFSHCRAVISPLKLEKDAAGILYYLAKEGFRCCVGTMPIAGATAPVTLAGSIALANAELLGVWTAIKAVNPDTECSSGPWLSVMDMRSGSLVYGAPEVFLQNLGLQQLCQYFYSLTPGLGALYVDGKLPSQQSAIERSLYYFCGAAFGMKRLTSFGFISQAQVISLEQTLVDLEVAKWTERFLNGFDVNEETLALDAICRVGIGGNFLQDEHTLKHFRETCWIPEIFDRSKCEEVSFRSYMESDMLKVANKKAKALMKDYEPFKLDKAKAEEIDRILEEAEKDLFKE